MKHKNFRGIAVHPARVSSTGSTLIGVWLGQKISPYQRKQLMRPDNVPKPGGHVGVRTSARGNTAVMFMGRVQSPKDARTTAIRLMRIVGEVTGAYSILRQLPNYRAVRHALAV